MRNGARNIRKVKGDAAAGSRKESTEIKNTLDRNIVQIVAEYGDTFNLAATSDMESSCVIPCKLSFA